MWTVTFTEASGLTIEIPGKPHPARRDQNSGSWQKRSEELSIPAVTRRSFLGTGFLCEVGYEPDIFDYYSQSLPAAQARGRGGTWLYPGTVPVHEKELNHHFPEILFERSPARRKPF